MNRQHWPDTERPSDEGMVELIYAAAVVVAAGIFGAALAFLVWGFR